MDRYRARVDVNLTERSERRGGSVPLHGYLALPSGQGPWPGVVVLHEIFGLDANARLHTNRLTEMGYAALAVDLYSAGGASRCLVSTMRSVLRGSGRAFIDIETARQEVCERPDVTDRVGVIGFCMGGGFALLAADSTRYAASSVNYGLIPKNLDALAGSCPVVASYGGADRALPGAAATLRTAFDEHGITHDVQEYPDVGHSFLNELPTGPAPLNSLTRVLGIGPRPGPAEHAWARIGSFFAEHLSDSSGGVNSG